MTIAEIKAQMTDAFIANETVKQLYNLQQGKTFEEQFSTVSLENILFFIVAMAMWLNVQLFDRHKTDVLAILRDNKAHTSNWYATRAKEFQFGYELSGDTDMYDNSQLTAEQIQAAQIVKFAASVETSDQSILFVKIASETNGVKQPISSTQLVAFTAYLGRIKDAGVRITVINSPADDLRLVMDIYYDPLTLDNSGKRLDGSNNTPVQNAIRDYISNLSFNGLYVNQSLVDKLQAVPGVEIAELKEASSRYGTQVNYSPINARSIPYAGYYRITDSNLVLNFIANE
jgi:hypothetical protein